MNSHFKAAPAAQDILRTWLPFKASLGVTSARTAADYAAICATIEALLDTIGDDETHPLAEVLDFLGHQAKIYEDAHVAIPEGEPREVLRFLIQQHGLRQRDLPDCAPQSRISEILRGKRAVSVDIAKKLARRFSVNAGVFL